jgi:hypothetical protein
MKIEKFRPEISTEMRKTPNIRDGFIETNLHVSRVKSSRLLASFFLAHELQVDPVGENIVGINKATGFGVNRGRNDNELNLFPPRKKKHQRRTGGT